MFLADRGHKDEEYGVLSNIFLSPKPQSKQERWSTVTDRPTRKWLRRGLFLSAAALLVYFFTQASSPSLVSTRIAQHSSALALNHEGSGWTSFDNIFAFGDSYTSYHREEREDQPPFKCRIMTEGQRFRRKPNWITFLTEVFNTTEVTSVNFAEGGSTVDRNVVAPFAMGWTLKDEVKAFLDSYSLDSPALKWRPETSLFTIWFGVNDITMPHTRSVVDQPLDRPAMRAVFESYSNSIDTLYKAGARNFLLMAVPPFDRSLYYPKDDWHVKRQQATIADITDFNSRLFDLWEDFQHTHSDATTHLFDSHRFYSRMISEPTAFPGTAHVTNTVGVCMESEDAKQPGPLDIAYEFNTCIDGNLIQSYVWTALHSTYPVNNATAWQVVQDCFTGGATKGYCH